MVDRRLILGGVYEEDETIGERWDGEARRLRTLISFIFAKINASYKVAILMVFEDCL